ncbi:MAG: hypothetical protein GF320_18760 [Armatimonadia bacterium]|nr:hypothetical protein [Armatimonadia bacterium]
MQPTRCAHPDLILNGKLRWPPASSGFARGFESRLGRAVLYGSQLDAMNGGGPIAKFESCFRREIGGSHVLAVSSGAAGLHVALMAAGVEPGHEVIVPGYGWGQVLVFLDALGAAPVFVDVLPDTLCIDPAAVRDAITPHTKAILAVHQFGCPADMRALASTAEEHGITLIEDCAAALGAEIEGVQVGLWGNIGVFSFNARKHLPLGEGGMIVFRDHRAWETALGACQHGDRCALQGPSDLMHGSPDLFWPYRINPMAAALGCEMLPKTRHWGQARRAAHEALLGQLASRFPELGLPRDPPYGRHAWGSLVLHGPPGSSEDGEWISELRRHGLGMRPGPVLAALPDRPEVLSYWPASTHCPNAARAARTTAFLPRSVALGIAPAEGGPTP